MFSPLIFLISSVGFSTFSITGLVQAIPRLPDVFGPIPSVTLDKDLIQFSQLLFNYTRKYTSLKSERLKSLSYEFGRIICIFLI